MKQCVRNAFLFALLGPTICGCAISQTVLIDGQPVPRLNVVITGHPYTLRHSRAHPRPGSPSGGLRSDGGTIRGRICGRPVDYDVDHKGDHVQLVGTVDGNMPSQLQIAERPGYLAISGALGDQSVDLQLFDAKLRGFIGWSSINLAPFETDGKDWGRIVFTRVVARGNKMRLMLKNAAGLWDLSPALVAVLAPHLSDCMNALSFEPFNRAEMPSLRIGGPAGDMPAFPQ